MLPRGRSMQAIDWLSLEQLPESESALHRTIISMYPAWTGPEQGSLRHGSSLRAVMISLPCRQCRKTVEVSLRMARKLIRRGQSGTTCGRECADLSRRGENHRRVQTQRERPKGYWEFLRLSRWPSAPQELIAELVKGAPHWLGQKPGTLKPGDRCTHLILLIPCVRCGKQMEIKHTLALWRMKKGRQQMYCSVACNTQAQQTERACEICGKPIPRKHARQSGRDKMPKRGRRTCSKACYQALWHQSRKLMPINCGECGVEFQPKSYRTQFCSQVCKNAAHSKRIQGLGNMNYKHGRSYAALFNRMRPLIIERDERKCRACLATMPAVEKLRALGQSGWPIHHVNEIPWDNEPQNLILLCKSCHARHHHSNVSPYPWLAEWAALISWCMTSKWKEQVASLHTRFSSITADSSTARSRPRKRRAVKTSTTASGTGLPKLPLITNVN